MIGSHERTIDGIELSPHSFMGHGWLFAYKGGDPEIEKKLSASDKTFTISDDEKKNRGSVVFRSTNNNGGSRNQAPARKRGCCGSR